MNEDNSFRKQERLDNMLTVGVLSGLVILMAVGVILFLRDKTARQAAAVPPPVRRVEGPTRRTEDVAPEPKPVVTAAEPVTNSSPPRVVEPPPAEVVTILPASNENPVVVTPEPSGQIVVTNVEPATAEAEPPDEIEAKGISSEAASSDIATAMSDVVAAETREKLMKLSREVFKRKNDPRFAGNSNLMRVANAVAVFNLHYPTREESKEMVTLCCELMQTNCVEDVATAIEGSMYLFENEIIMMDLGYARFGRIWVDSREMAAIQARLAERERKIAEYIASQNTITERFAESESTRPVRTFRTVSVDEVGTLLKNTRKIRRIGHSLESKTLMRPSTYIRRIGDSITGTE